MKKCSRVLLLLVAMLATHVVFANEVSETVLSNGLKVLIKESHAAPVVVVDVWYKAGSRNERPGMTGASHLLEHMTYKGTREFAKNDMRNLTKRNGALDNGATFYDYTHYHTTIASDRLSLVLRMEASRMRNALIKQEDLDAERTVVRSELEGNENNPGTLLFQETMSAAFRAHPYRWPVIGFRADVEQVTADELRAYYRTYYVPNNATLVIVGAVNTKEALAEVKKTFGRIPRGAQPNQWVTPEPPQYGERRVTVRRHGQLPIVYLSWHIPNINHEDIPALTMLDQVLGTGRLSPLYQQIVETQFGVSAWTQMLTRRDSGVFVAGGAAAPGGELAPIERTILQEIEKIKETPPGTTALARGLRQIEAALIFGRDSVTDQAQQLGEAETVAGSWRYPDTLLAALRTVTAVDVSRVARLYLTENNRTVGIFQPVARGGGQSGVLDAPAALQQWRESLLRDVAPAKKPATAVPVAAARPDALKRERVELPNGITLLMQENHANPTVAVSIIVRAGKAYEPVGKRGVADLLTNLFDRGAGTRTSQQIAEELEGAAAEISASTGWETAGMHGKALSGDTDLLLRNMAEQLRHATFPAEEIEKMREQMLSSLAMSLDNPSEAARRAFYRTVLPEGNGYRLASFEEEEAGLKAISREDLLAFYQARYRPNGIIISIVGDITLAQARSSIERYFGDWQGEKPAQLNFTGAPAGNAGQLVVTIPDKSSASIYVGHAAMLRRTAPDYYAAEIMNLILGGGGALNSRLGDVIRDQNGLAYSVYSTFHASSGAGPWYAVLGVNPQNVDKAVGLVQAEIARMHEHGVNRQELADAVAYISGAYAISLETNGALARTLADAEYFQLGLDYPEQVGNNYRALTREQINAAAQKYLHPDVLTTVIAGTYLQEQE